MTPKRTPGPTRKVLCLLMAALLLAASTAPTQACFSVVVGKNEPAAIVEMVGDTQLKLGRSISWKEGDPANLPFKGRAPDIGAREFAQDPKQQQR